MPGPEAPDAQDGARSPDLGAPPALTLLRKRGEFLRAAQAGRTNTPAFLLQARERSANEAAGLRVGFTCSKKVGNAVARNRAKRRLREIARAVLPVAGRQGWDYVLIGKAGVTADHPMEAMRADLVTALERVHQTRAGKGTPVDRRPRGKR